MFFFWERVVLSLKGWIILIESLIHKYCWIKYSWKCSTKINVLVYFQNSATLHDDRYVVKIRLGEKKNTVKLINVCASGNNCWQIFFVILCFTLIKCVPSWWLVGFGGIKMLTLCIYFRSPLITSLGHPQSTVHSPIATFTVHAALALRQLDKVVTLRVR